MRWLRSSGSGFWVLPVIFLLRALDQDPPIAFTVLALMVLGGLITWAFRATATPSDVRFVGRVRIEPLKAAAGARCLVCRSELGGEIIYCASCHTPHHRECFTYAGRCSVYACRAREFRRAA